MNAGLEGKVVIITGSAAGIGLESVKLIAAEGAKIVMADLNEHQVRTEASSLSLLGYDVLPSVVDVSDKDSVDAMVANAVETYGTVDVLVNNAGIGIFKGLDEETFEEWKKVLDVNLTGVHLCTKAVFDVMKKNPGGKIISMGSLGGQIGGIKVTPGYVASKAGVMGVTKSYARHGAQYGITANAIAPGLVETDMTRGRYSADITLLGRLGVAEDVAKIVLFLASSLSDYLTGVTIDVNGGILMR